MKSARLFYLDALNVLRAFFSRAPMSAINEAQTTRSPVWVFFAVTHILAIGAAVPVWLYFFLNRLSFFLSSRERHVTALNLYAWKYIYLCLISMAIAAFSLLLLFAGLYLLRLITRQKYKLTAALNVVSVSLLPVTAAALSAIVISWASPAAAAALLLLSYGIFMHLVYQGIQSLGLYSFSPFWLFAAVMAVHHCVILSQVMQQISLIVYWLR